jgi:hypothetical protein
MIAELVAFNAAFGVVKEFISNGKDLSDCFGQIGQMVNCKEDLKARQQKTRSLCLHLTQKNLWPWSRSQRQRKN